MAKILQVRKKAVRFSGDKTELPAPSRKLPVARAKRSLNIDTQIDHHVEDHTPLINSWSLLQKESRTTHIEYSTFSKRLFNILGNARTVTERVGWVVNYLEKHGFRELSKLSGYTSLDLLDQPEDARQLKAGARFYEILKNGVVMACQLGRFKTRHGFHVGLAHLDSPCVRGFGNFTEQNGIASMNVGSYGDFVPDAWVNRKLGIEFLGYKDEKGKSKPLRLMMGDKQGEPNFYIARESSHLDDMEGVSRAQLRVMMGSGAGARGKGLENVLKFFHSQFGLTREDIRCGRITFFPLVKPIWVGTENNAVASYGLDDLACAFPLLEGFVKTINPNYTAVLHLHTGEEVGDASIPSVAEHVLAETFLAAVSYLRGEGLGDHYTGLDINGVSLWSDVMEVRHAFDPKMHDPYDSAYFHGGVAVERSAGDEDLWGGMEPLPETLAGFRNLLRGKQIPWQFCTMGNPEERIVSGDSEVHHPLRTRYAINVGTGILSAHRAGEIGSVPDMFYLSKLAHAFWSMRYHKDYFPDAVDYTTEVTRGKFRQRDFFSDMFKRNNAKNNP